MRKLTELIATMLAFMLVLAGCQVPVVAETTTETKELETAIEEELTETIGTGDYKVEVKTYYVSKEYIEDMEFRDRKTNWFGYYLEDVDLAMEGQKWVFTVIDGKTGVKVFEPYDDSYDVLLRGVAIGAGVVVVCITVSLISGGSAGPVVYAVLALPAAKELPKAAVKGVMTGTTTAVLTNGDVKEALLEAASESSSTFMWAVVEEMLPNLA
ncbi:MAG: hypothetical protein IKE30_00040 [Clostridia bacterium]|nr:hypothetical protein [Clostridia bacterium]